MRNSIVAETDATAACVTELEQSIGNLTQDGTRAEGTAADARFCTETDQLGRARPQGGGCDIGAIEAMPAAEARSDCVVTTTQELDLRDGPNGNRIGVLPRSTAVVAEARTARWFNVEYQSTTGWIRAEHVLTRGVCG